MNVINPAVCALMDDLAKEVNITGPQLQQRLEGVIPTFPCEN
jgi:hypothetical protein